MTSSGDLKYLPKIGLVSKGSIFIFDSDVDNAIKVDNPFIVA